MKFTVILIFIALLFVTGCISTRVTSLVDPQYRDSSYGRILVVADYSQLEMIKMVEKQMVQDLLDSGVFAVANSDLLPPLRKYSDEEITVIYSKYDLDACLIITPMGEKSEGFYLPGWTGINQNIDVNKGFGAIPGSTTVTTSVLSTPGTYENRSYVDTRAELRDIRSGALVSRCETNSEQTSYNTSTQPLNEQLVQSVCEKMVEEFNKNKLLRRK